LTQQKEVAVVIPQETKQGIVVQKPEKEKDKEKEKVENIPIPTSEDEARNIIARFESGAPRGDSGVSDSVSSHVLRDKTSLLDERWYGTEQEELDSYVTELLYIHTKLMIVDDRRVIMGSANFNDRSQKGDGDSEIALVVEDVAQIPSTMDGKPFKVASFATTLRRKLFREHLGLIPPQSPNPKDQKVAANMKPAPHPYDYDFGSREDTLVADPVAGSTMQLWQQTAKKNREIYTDVFKTVPNNIVRNWEIYEQYIPKVRAGHVAPGVTLDRVKERLSQVKGQLVECPLDFLIEDKGLVSGPEWTELNPTLPIFL